MTCQDALRIGPCTDDDVDAVVDLWRVNALTRPWNDPHADLARARANPSSEVLVLREDGLVLGAVMVGYDGHRGWMYYLAVSPERKMRGLGRQLVRAAERWLTERECPKVEVMVRGTNREVLAFYDHLGYEEQDVVVRARWLPSG